MFITLDIFKAILVALIITFVCVPPGVWLTRKIGLIDYPDAAPHKRHRHPTPMAGGIILVLALGLSGTISGVWLAPTVTATFVTGLVIFFFGLWDDLKDIAPIYKLLGQLLAAILLINWGVSVQIFESPQFFVSLNPVAARWIDIVLTTFWLVGMTNAFNFIDSMDGLAVGIGGVAAGFFMLLTLDSGQTGLAIYSAGLAAICLGIYFFNARPARLFLGDAGAQLLGFLLASLAIAYNPQDVNQMSSWFATVLLLGVPIFDMILVVVSRLRRNQPIYSSARDHTYHRLREMGFAPYRAVLLMHIAAVILGCLAIVGLHQPPLIANIMFGIIIICGLGLLVFFEIFLYHSQDNPKKS
jgi:UDP-GlcNAc:undecaprenyl-phosphate GlcNAc-1-phosphate transferase